ncbi:hypothetical protein BDV23DRAFT_151194 [Aspergillus alliaceus]|uniref:Uncharacterized protein n=1 Tax=Petromyces alliaceus TaxID=209559 RepID=A0A5N7CE79_PETAA|nr:hypothetical protein BDV23DRAFT_151194 [Aspergillus alliaceus]
MAAACAKEILSVVPHVQIDGTGLVSSRTQAESRGMDSRTSSLAETYHSGGGPMFLGNQSAENDINVRTDWQG